MVRRLRMCVTALLMIATGVSCRSTTPSAETPFDPSRAAAVLVVLRIEHLFPQGGSEMYCSTVRVLNVIKNDTEQTFTGQIPVWYGGMERYALPPGICSVYLEPFKEDRAEGPCWRLRQRRTRTGMELGYSHRETGVGEQDRSRVRSEEHR